MRNRPDAQGAWQFIRTWHLDPSHEAALAIMAATMLEQALESAISTHFAVKREEAESIFVDQSEGSISALSMKIKLAYALGVIEQKIRKELIIVKTIRNELAHSSNIGTFLVEKIATHCSHLFIWKEIPIVDNPNTRADGAKRKYANSIEYIYGYLIGSVTKETERVPLLFEDSEFYCAAFLHYEPARRENAFFAPSQATTD